ncbi:DUF3472 domain-containing protein [Mucilaginibacter glaciei]|uniref:DUF3472 domain-containing protein n=1 Tax=Mucilaginibacter glaciei TaxID=2772109 RepID=A0A926NTB1_9SPHI|nr:DUF3472 domain-containing protein [Mucilaginibacter glaciei]MBD1393585.1 DUF3472 domain-containing protein [Mucilaginibacter glaciei]
MKKILLALLLIANLPSVAQSTKVVIPFGGNAFASGSSVITDDGLTKWSDPKAVTVVYFRTDLPQTFKLSLRLRVPVGKSRIRITAGTTIFNKTITNAAFDTISIGELTVTTPGYIKISLKGLSKTGNVYAEVTDLIVENVNPDDQLTYVKTGSSFHFGRRGPSVHLRYAVPAAVKQDVKWFYNEIEVPQKMDVVGSYFMADGFNGGYFGMQVNSATERRVLFSVWSPFQTDDPKSIPDSLRVKLTRKGSTVHGGEFGSEGSGGQSYLQYPWQAGKTYAFLLRAESDKAHNTTTYTAWLKDVAAGNWMLIAGFNRPQTAANLTGLYSFVENFEPDNGDKIRMAHFKNQWIADSNGKWYELTSATYTGDETAKKNYRKDYAGGLAGNVFFLQNGGFFDSFVPLGKSFERPAGKAPVIDLNALPTN